jgi:HlyD family secretion protein
MNASRPSRRRERGAALVWIVLVVLALAVGGVVLWQERGPTQKAPTTLPYVVQHEKMRVSVVESGQLKAAKSVDVYCEVKGSSTILELVDEGTKVKPGDLLVHLDSSTLEDELTAQKIKKLNAEAAMIQAEKTKEIQESKNASDVQQAELNLSLAIKDLEKYDKGDYVVKQKQSEADLKVALADEENKKNTERDTKELVDLNFAAKTQYDADHLAAQQAELKSQICDLTRRMLDLYEKPRQMLVLNNSLAQTTAELDRVKLRCVADLAQKTADYESKKATYDLEKNKLADLEQQVDRTVIKAKVEGLVVYPVNQNGMGGRGSDRDRIEAGATAREHQLLMSLPDTTEMVVVVSVHESAIDKVKAGLPAVVTIDARPDLSYVGKVTFIAPLPDAQNQWLNPDLKVYRCEITLGGDTHELRPGMSASAEIVIDELPDAIAIPLHAVYRRGDTYFVYADAGEGKCDIREVKIGMHNDQRVAVTEGLKEGDKVFLSVPSGAPTPKFSNESTKKQTASVDDLRKQADGIVSKPKDDPSKPDAARKGPVAGGFDWSKMQGKSQEEVKKAYEEWLATLTPEEKAKQEELMKKFRQRGPGGAGGGAGGGAAKPGGSN